MVDLCEYFDKKKNFENKEKTTVGFRENKKKFRRSYSKRLLNFKDPDFVGIVEKVTNKLFFESPKINRFTFVNSGVGYILRYFFVPKPEFSKLKDLLRNCFYKKLAESPKRRSAAYHRRIFYRKRNNVTVCFKKYFIKPRLSVVFTEHAIKNTFAFIVRRRKLKQTFYKKIIIKKYLSKYYNVKTNYLRPIQKKLNRLNLFVSYLENRLDFFLVKSGFFKNVNTARFYISKGFVILNFRVCTTPLRVVKVGDFVWVSRKWFNFNTRVTFVKRGFGRKIRKLNFLNEIDSRLLGEVSCKYKPIGSIHLLYSESHYINFLLWDQNFLNLRVSRQKQLPLQDLKTLDFFLKTNLY